MKIRIWTFKIYSALKTIVKLEIAEGTLWLGDSRTPRQSYSVLIEAIWKQKKNWYLKASLVQQVAN